jgi:hypothetical protein
MLYIFHVGGNHCFGEFFFKFILAAIGVASLLLTFAVHQPSGIPRVVPSKSRLLQPWLHCREDRHIFFPTCLSPVRMTIFF